SRAVMAAAKIERNWELMSGDVMLERKFHLLDEPTSDLVILIGRHVQDQNGYFRCLYEITGLGHDRSTHIAGVDEIDALVNALSMTGSWLNGVNQSDYRGRLRWVGGGEDGDLGFPTVEGR